MRIRRTLIRNEAQNILKKLGITEPPVDLYKVANSLNVEIRKEVPPTKDEDLSGFLFRDTSRGTAIIGINPSHSKPRRRFTIAHEIGHYLLHKSSSTYVDRRFVVNLRSSESSSGKNIEEMEANLFAAELLMPYNFIDNDMVGFNLLDIFGTQMDEMIHNLADKYVVSVQALNYRLMYLGYLDELRVF